MRTVTSVPPQPYGRNLAALAASQPDVAELVEAEPIPESATLSTGRDGTRTFQVADETGRLTWLGGSSMPSISAPEVLTEAEGGGNGSAGLPGILTGLEPLVLLWKLLPHEAVFVLEECLLHLKLAMHLYDYSDAIARQQLVFIPTAALTGHLAAFHRDHPGHLLPARLVAVPQRSSVYTTELRQQLESAGTAAAASQDRTVQDHVEQLGARAFDVVPDPPRVAVLGVDARPRSLEQARRISRGLASLGWRHEVCVPDAPSRCHISARLAAIRRVEADVVLFVNGSPGSLCQRLPDTLPVLSWYLPGSTVEPSLRGGLREGQLSFAATRSLADAVLATGIDPSTVELSDVAADETIFHPTRQQAELAADRPIDVAILMDLPDIRPEAVGVTLGSHVTLWRAMEKAVWQRVDRYEHETAEGLIDVAQRASGTALQDESIRSRFAAALRERLAPAVIARAAASALADLGVRIALFGTNWPAVAMPQPGSKAVAAPESLPTSGPVPIGAELNDLFNATDIVVLPEGSGLAAQAALDALAAGTQVILRSDPTQFVQQQPGLADLTPYLRFYRTRRQLIEAVRRGRTLRADWFEQSPGLRAMIQARHTVRCRLSAILARVREHKSRKGIAHEPGHTA